MQNSKPEFHKQITHQIFERVWNQANFEGLEKVIDPGTKFHIRNRILPMSAQDTSRVIAGWYRAFPDIHFTIEAMVAEDDLVAVRLILTGTHQGAWKEIPATGKQINVTAMMFLRYQKGKLVEIWEDFDELGLLQQLGVGE